MFCVIHVYTDVICTNLIFILAYIVFFTTNSWITKEIISKWFAKEPIITPLSIMYSILIDMHRYELCIICSKSFYENKKNIWMILTDKERKNLKIHCPSIRQKNKPLTKFGIFSWAFLLYYLYIYVCIGITYTYIPS